MEVQSKWYDDIAKQISLYKDSLNKKDYKKYKLDLLLRVATRVDSFSSGCGECQMFQSEISGLVEDINYVINMSMSKEKRQSYSKRLNNIVKHLQKQHKLVTEGQYLGIGLALGTAIGVAIGAGSDNVGVGIPIGIGIGIAIGAGLDAKAKKEGKVI